LTTNLHDSDSVWLFSSNQFNIFQIDSTRRLQMLVKFLFTGENAMHFPLKLTWHLKLTYANALAWEYIKYKYLKNF